MSTPIRFTEMSAQNAMTFEKFKVRLDNQGLVLVRGINHDSAKDGGDSSNGAAKSAIFEILRHVMLGSTARGIKGKELVRAGSEGGYLGTVSVEKAGERYTINQAVGHKKHGTATHLYRGNQMVSHQRAKVRTQQSIADDLLGMTPEQFDSIVFVSQEAAHPLVSGTGAECAKYISDTFGLNVYDAIKEKIKEQVKLAERKLGEADAFEQMLQRANEKLSGIGDMAEIEQAAEQSAKEQTIITRKADATQQKLMDLRKVAQDATTRESLIKKMGVRAEMSAEEISGALSTARKKRSTVAQRIADAKAARRQQELAHTLTRKLEVAKQVVSGTDPDQLADAATKIEKQVQKLEAKVESLGGAPSTLARLEDLDGEAGCPTCGQKLSAEHLAAELARAREARIELRDAKQTLATRRAELAEIKSTAARYARAVTECSDLSAQLSQIVVPGNSEATERDEERLEGLDELIHDMERASSLRDQVDRLPSDVDAEAALAAVDDLDQRVKRLREAAREAQTAASQAQALLVEAKHLTEQAAEARQKIDQLGQVKHENDLRKTLIKALGRLKVRRAHGIVDAIQKTIPPYVSAMFGGEDVQVVIDDENPESIERWCSRPSPGSADRTKIPLRAMSKGERARLRVAFIWAVRRLMQPERTVNILVLDEADGGLDRQGLEAYASLLEQLRGEYESIFVISHRRELSTVVFDNEWVVEKREGISQLRDTGSRKDKQAAQQ